LPLSSWKIVHDIPIVGPQQRAAFEDDGYLVLRGALKNIGAFDALMGELKRYAECFNDGFELLTPESVLNLSVEERRALYCGLRYLPSLYQFVSCPEILAISKALGLTFPGVELFNNIRMDLPGEDRFLFQWHQDLSYNLGSVNSITYWIPLSRTDAHHGGIEVIRGSHKRGLWPCEVVNPSRKVGLLSTRDIVITEPQTPATTIETEFGDIVVFSQLLLHKSLSSRSSNTRWTVQIRHTDFAEPYFREAGFPMGDMTTLDRTSYLQDWTTEHGAPEPR
jgi:ectoine hydroxylase-related dioxygenase (phytanoyl-CoA dioxygenase family)